jgi:very-short-patch-repair endonuclease
MPVKQSNPETMHQAAKLRKVPTPAEKKLWSYLRGDKLNGVCFRRQHAIGNFTSTGSVQASLILFPSKEN